MMYHVYCITNILNKKSWKNATKHLPDIDLKERSYGELWCLAKLNAQTVKNIKLDIRNMKLSGEIGIGRKLAEKYNASKGQIYNIMCNVNWKHIKI